MLNEITLNRMKRKIKSKITQPSPKRVIFYFVVVFVTILVLFYTYNAVMREQISNYRQEIQNIQTDFNNINTGWTYDEYCTGYGSDITRENIKICYLVLSLDYYPQNDNFNEYLNLLSTDYNYVLLRPIETVPESIGSDKNIRVSSMTAPFGKKVSCKVADASYSFGKTEGYYFVCSFEAKEFYFERRNG